MAHLHQLHNCESSCHIIVIFEWQRQSINRVQGPDGPPGGLDTPEVLCETPPKDEHTTLDSDILVDHGDYVFTETRISFSELIPDNITEAFPKIS